MDRILCKHKPSENVSQNIRAMGCANCGNVILLTKEEHHALFALIGFNFSYEKSPHTQHIINTMMSCCGCPSYYYGIFKSHGYTDVRDLEIKNGKVVEIKGGSIND